MAEPPFARAAAGGPVVAPAHPDRGQLARIWAGMLDVEEVGGRDDFLVREGTRCARRGIVGRVRTVIGGHAASARN